MAGSSVIPMIVLLTVIQTAMCNVLPHPAEFFPDVKDNLTKIIWSHAVNSMRELETALSSENSMMLEADIVLGKLNSNDTNIIPITAHPPNTESDLSLDNLLNRIIKKGTKGIKLDFKTSEAFNKSKDILTKLRPKLKVPVFLNADILPGSANASAPSFVAKDFLKDANNTMPEATLSIGWTTRYMSRYTTNETLYTSKQVKEMVDTVTESQITQPVTYPIRASFAMNDIDVLKTLIKNTTSTNATLTIWEGKDDYEYVNALQLSKFIKDIGVDKVYLDVSDNLRKKLDLSTSSSMSPMMNLGATLALMVIARML